jgi:hypothetical protein
MSTGAKWINGILNFFDKSTVETVKPLAPILFEDDFLADQIQTSAAGVCGWTLVDTGAATETIIANQHGGVLGLTLTSASEKQEAGVHFGDALNFDMDKGPIIEFRATLNAAPTLLTEIYFGMANAYAEGPLSTDGPTIHAMFCFDGAVTPVLYSDDTSNDVDATATGVTAVVDTYNIYRIDFTDVSDVKFFIDGNRVGSGTTHDMSTGSAVVLQPFIMAHKESGAGLGILHVDYVRVWGGR